MSSVTVLFNAWKEGFEKRTLVSWQSYWPTIFKWSQDLELGLSKRRWIGLPLVETLQL